MRQYRQKYEWILLFGSLLIGLVVVALAIFALTILDFDDLALNDLWGTILLYPLGAAIIRRYMQANAQEKFLPVTKEQFPDIYALLVEAATAYKIKVPAAYLVLEPAVNPCIEDYGNSPFVLIGTDFYAGCRENNTPEALKFIVYHQVAHLAAGHGSGWWHFATGILFSIPVLRGFLTRSQEFTADVAAANFAASGAAPAIHLCAVGKDNYVYANWRVQLERQKSRQARRKLLRKINRFLTDQPSSGRRLALLEKRGLLPD